MLETRSMPLRNYLMKHVMPTLTEGLIEACKVKPDDPVDYLVSCHTLWGRGLKRMMVGGTTIAQDRFTQS